MGLLDIYFYLQCFNTTIAICLNGLLIFLVLRYSSKNMGNYRYLIASFAIFETVYAMVVFIGMPVNYVADHSWMVFTHSELLASTSFAVLGPALYCTFYEMWMAYVVVHFLYRYIVVCRPGTAKVIQESLWPKLLFTLMWILCIVFTIMCGVFFCTRVQMSKKMAELIRDDYGIQNPEGVGYILLSKRNSIDNSISFAGTTSILNHFFLVFASSGIIFFCGIKIWKSIMKMKNDAIFLRDHAVQKQMFLTLVVQTLVPILFCIIPSLIYLSFPFWESDISFGGWSLMFSILTSISKWIDPIIVMVCIKEYRHAIHWMITGRPNDHVHVIGSGDYHGHSESQVSNHQGHIEAHHT